MIKWTVETRKISDLKPHPSNPRSMSTHDAKHLQASLQKFGLIDKPVITKEGIIIGGHQRINILKKMKQSQIECYVPDKDLSQQEIDELNIRLNRNSGEWDFDILANEWAISDLLDYGFLSSELDLSDVETVESEEEKSKSQKKLKMCPSCGHEF